MSSNTVSSDCKTILITGCSSGIGLCAAKILKSQNYRVFATARKLKDVEYLKSLDLEAYLLDVSDDNSIEKTCDLILEKTGGRLDALFNNAGFGMVGSITDLRRENLEAQFNTNVFGAMMLIKKILPVMIAQGHGRIIQNSSILGFMSLPYYGAYNASKHALEAFSDTLRQELRGKNIWVSIIEPGPIESAFRHNAQTQFQEQIDLAHSVHGSIYQQIKTTNQKSAPFMLKPEKVIEAVIHALEAKRPRTRYPIALPGKILYFLKQWLPDRVFDWFATSLIMQIKSAPDKKDN
jgi:short-subunit dehydrogenase